MSTELRLRLADFVSNSSTEHLPVPQDVTVKREDTFHHLTAISAKVTVPFYTHHALIMHGDNQGRQLDAEKGRGKNRSDLRKKKKKSLFVVNRGEAKGANMAEGRQSTLHYLFARVLTPNCPRRALNSGCF